MIRSHRHLIPLAQLAGLSVLALGGLIFGLASAPTNGAAQALSSAARATIDAPSFLMAESAGSEEDLSGLAVYDYNAPNRLAFLVQGRPFEVQVGNDRYASLVASTAGSGTPVTFTTCQGVKSLRQARNLYLHAVVPRGQPLLNRIASLLQLSTRATNVTEHDDIFNATGMLHGVRYRLSATQSGRYITEVHIQLSAGNDRGAEQTFRYGEIGHAPTIRAPFSDQVVTLPPC